MSSSSEIFQDLVPHHRPWSDLPIDILSDIASRLETTLDVAHFALVCPAWKVASYTNELHHSRQFPWLLLAETDLETMYCWSMWHTDPRTGTRRFINMTDNNQMRCPLVAACGRRCIGSGYGWLVMLSTDEQITMVSPLSGACLQLPSQSTLKFPSEWHHKEKYRSYISKIAVGKDKSGGILAVAIAGVRRKLAIARPTDKKWTAVKCKWSQITDAIIHQERVYAVDNKGMLIVCNLDGQVEGTTDPPKERLHRRHTRYIIVSLSGKLLQIVREYTKNSSSLTVGFTAFELLEEEGRWLQIKDLGDQALFVGFNTSTSMKASGFTMSIYGLPRCETNCVYYTEDCIEIYRHTKYGGGCDTGKCILNDRSSLKTYFAGECHYSPPVFYIPRLP